jgi:phospholipase/lecithinase/hemolysin
VWAGANDYLPTQSSFVPYTEPTTTIGNLSQALSTLASVGAKNFLVVNLPNLGSTPLLNNTSASSAFNTLAQAHNSSLNTALGNLSQSLGSDVNIISFDVNSLFSEAINNPQQFGFTNVTNACILNLQCVTNPNVQKEFLFWDNIHPTTTTHEIIADRALEQIPEPSFVLGMITFAAFVGTGKMHKRKS